MLKGKAVVLVCQDVWATGNNELGYVRELKQKLRDAPKSGLLISTRDRTIAQAVSGSPVNFECVEPLGRKAREILGWAAFGPNWDQITFDRDAKLKYLKILKVCARLPLAIGIAGSALKSVDGEQRYMVLSLIMRRLNRGKLNRLQYPNGEYDRDGLNYVVKASLQLCELWGFSGGRNRDTRHLFQSMFVLEEQQLIPESTLERYSDLDEQQVGDAVENFTNLRIVKQNLLKRSSNNSTDVSHSSMSYGIFDFRIVSRDGC